MEKVMSVEEKIRRAEEIYYRRKNQEMPIKDEMNINTKPKRNIKLLKKMIKQIIMCLIIYAIFYLIINNNYVFSEDFTNKVKEILSQDINFSHIYSIIQNTTTSTEEKSQNEETKTEENDVKEEIQNNDENIGGAQELPTTGEQIVENVENTVEEPVLSQMEQDINNIKSTVNFIKPVNGTISSMFRVKKSYNSNST